MALLAGILQLTGLATVPRPAPVADNVDTLRVLTLLDEPIALMGLVER